MAASKKTTPRKTTARTKTDAKPAYAPRGETHKASVKAASAQRAGRARAAGRKPGIIADRPYMPAYGIAPAPRGRGLLPWSWARQRLEASRNYWIVSVRPDGRPHASAVWGVWLDDAFYFSSDATSRKAKNLAARNDVTVAMEHEGNETIIVDGVAGEERGKALIKRFQRAYEEKYDWKMDPLPGAVYCVAPRVVLAIGAEPFEQTATRWRFQH